MTASGRRALWTQAALRVPPGAYLAKPCRDGRNPAAAFIRMALVDDIASTEDALRRLCGPITEYLSVPEPSDVMMRTGTLTILPVGRLTT